jgi:hypothetical protein
MILVALVATCFCAEAQQPKKVPRIGFLGNTSVNDSIKPFRGRLRELGYIEGQNIIIEPRYYEGTDLSFVAVNILSLPSFPE